MAEFRNHFEFEELQENINGKENYKQNKTLTRKQKQPGYGIFKIVKSEEQIEKQIN